MPGDLPLTRGQRGLLREALRDAFGNFAQLRNFVDEELDDKLTSIAVNLSMDDGVAEVIRWAEQTGRSLELVVALEKKRGGNPKVIELMASINATPVLVSSAKLQAVADLETTALALAAQIPIADDAKWVAAARRLHPMQFFREGATRQEAIHALVSMSDPVRAGELTTALLLRMADLALGGAAPILHELGPWAESARRLCQNVFAPRKVYLLSARLERTDELRIENAWFCGGADGTPSVPLDGVPPEGLTLDEAIGIIEQHMGENFVDGAAIELIAPIEAVLHPPEDLEPYYCVLFRWRDRAEGKGRFQRVGRRVRELTQAIKARTSNDVRVEWFDPQGAYADLFSRMQAATQARLDVPALRPAPGGAVEHSLDEVKRFLTESATPFAAVVRLSGGTFGQDEEDSVVACAAATALCHLPVAFRGRRTMAQGAAFKHISILWDDSDNNPFYTYS